MYFGFAILEELKKVGTPQIRKSGSEFCVPRDDLFEQRNRRFERLRPIVVRQQIVCPPVVILLGGQWRLRDGPGVSSARP